MSGQDKDAIWAALLYFGMNMWCDQPVKAYKDYSTGELGLIAVADHLPCGSNYESDGNFGAAIKARS